MFKSLLWNGVKSVWTYVCSHIPQVVCNAWDCVNRGSSLVLGSDKGKGLDWCRCLCFPTLSIGNGLNPYVRVQWLWLMSTVINPSTPCLEGRTRDNGDQGIVSYSCSRERSSVVLSHGRRTAARLGSGLLRQLEERILSVLIIRDNSDKIYKVCLTWIKHRKILLSSSKPLLHWQHFVLSAPGSC